MSGAVLLATIGLQDPIGERSEPTGPLRAALHLRPATVVLLHSAGTRSQAAATAHRIGDDVGPVATRLCLLDGDPSDQAAMLERCRELIEELRADSVFRKGCPVEVCATSGTPAMSTALTLAVAARYPQASHWQALNPSQAAAGTDLQHPPDTIAHLATVMRAASASHSTAADTPAGPEGTPASRPQSKRSNSQSTHRVPWSKAALSASALTPPPMCSRSFRSLASSSTRRHISSPRRLARCNSPRSSLPSSLSR
jgi:hypothetical protein